MRKRVCQGTQAAKVHQHQHKKINCTAKVHQIDKVYETVDIHSRMLLFFREIFCYMMVYLPIKLYRSYMLFYFELHKSENLIETCRQINNPFRKLHDKFRQFMQSMQLLTWWFVKQDFFCRWMSIKFSNSMCKQSPHIYEGRNGIYCLLGCWDVCKITIGTRNEGNILAGCRVTNMVGMRDIRKFAIGMWDFTSMHSHVLLGWDVGSTKYFTATPGQEPLPPVPITLIYGIMHEKKDNHDNSLFDGPF